MPQPPAPSTAPTVLLDLPHTPGRAALRAALMAMRVPPLTLPPEPAQRQQQLAGLSSRAAGVAFIDISHRPGTPASGLADLFAQAPVGAARQRIMLTRLAEGHVSEADRQWVREFGFADLLPELEPAHAEGALRQAVDWAAQGMGLPTLPPAELARFARASAQPAGGDDARALIRRHTGRSAESLASALETELDIADRRWRLHTYERCFVGHEAVQRIASRWHCTPAEAVALGQALGRLGLLVHVVQEHPFLDEAYFYRLACSREPPAATLGTLWQSLSQPGGVQATTRHHLGRAYRDCWVGRDAVDHLCRQHKLGRIDAWLAMHRMMQFGLFEHVTRDRPFIDGTFFYRFAPTQAEVA